MPINQGAHRDFAGCFSSGEGVRANRAFPMMTPLFWKPSAFSGQLSACRMNHERKLSAARSALWSKEINTTPQRIRG
jgi:hypothetical protein